MAVEIKNMVINTHLKTGAQDHFSEKEEPGLDIELIKNEILEDCKHLILNVLEREKSR